MEKVKITKEQESLLKRYKEKGGGLGTFIRFRHVWMELSPLAIFSPDEFSKLLCGWYEVEQPFEIGEWVFNGKDYFEVMEDGAVTGLTLSYVLNQKGRFEKVTDPWKIKLLDLGRQKPEFKVGDVVETENDIYIFQDYNKERVLAEVIKEFERGTVEFIHPVESRIKVKSND